MQTIVISNLIYANITEFNKNLIYTEFNKYKDFQMYSLP